MEAGCFLEKVGEVIFLVANCTGAPSSGKSQKCCHQMSYFKVKMHRIRFRLRLCPRPLAGFKGPTSEGREGRNDGREGQGRGERRGWNLLLRRGVGEMKGERCFLTLREMDAPANSSLKFVKRAQKEVTFGPAAREFPWASAAAAGALGAATGARASATGRRRPGSRSASLHAPATDAPTTATAKT